MPNWKAPQEPARTDSRSGLNKQAAIHRRRRRGVPGPTTTGTRESYGGASASSFPRLTRAASSVQRLLAPVRGTVVSTRAAMTTRMVLYGSFGVLFSLLILIEVAGHAAGWRWTDAWMPNFIAEWSGLFIAVFVVERLLERDRAASLDVQLEPLRGLAGDAIACSVAPVVACAWLLNDDVLIEPYRVYTGKRYGAFTRPLMLTLTDRVDFWRRALTDAMAMTDRVRRDYSTLLHPVELVILDQFRAILEEMLNDSDAALSKLGNRVPAEFEERLRRIAPVFRRLTGTRLVFDHYQIRRAILKLRPEIRSVNTETLLRNRQSKLEVRDASE
jgi:hypothetical protein